ncbi:MAG: hypothetical protein HZA81_02135 [Candidatus Taylorbacteria bacterium]|nr:hypothetical protein [Candidatus Taylorbacteria bacterium]
MDTKTLSRPNAFKKAFSLLTLVALAASSIPGFSYTIPVAHANNGIHTYATPSSGTLEPGGSLEVHMTVPLDPNDSNPVVSPSCFVNGVDVTSTYENLTTGTDGHFKFTYTVSGGDTDRAAGQVPISCTLQQTGTVTVTAFDDGNTVAIDASEEPGGVGTTTLPSLSSVSIMPSSGSISEGDTAEVTFTESHGFTNLSLAGSCKVNNVDVSGTFQNIGGGHYRVTYTVDGNDAERPAGWVLLDCTLGNQDGTVRAQHPWSDGNTLSIDTNDDGSISNGTNTLGFTTTAEPGSGTLDAGDSLVVWFQDPLPSPDLAVGPTGCYVNGVDVASTFAHTSNGRYRVAYTVGAGDTERAQGQIPIDCSMQNDTGSVRLVSFTDGNTVAIDITSGGSGEGDAVTASLVPGSGIRVSGQDVEFYLEAPGQSFLSPFGACFVNNVDVSDTFEDLSGGLYRFIYTVGSTDAEREAGEIPVNCSLGGDSGIAASVSAWTDGNTVAIDSNGDGAIVEPTGGESNFIAGVFANPVSGTLTVGDDLEIYLQEGSGSEGFLPLVCYVNNTELTPTFEDLGAGFYKFTYTVASDDESRAAGEVPIACSIGMLGGPVLNAEAFTDGNTVAIDAMDDEGGATTTPSIIEAVSIVPSSGTVGAGATLDVYFDATGDASDISLGGVCTVNGVSVAGTFQNLTGGLYRVNYTVGQNDAERAAGQIPISCALQNSAGATTTVSAFTDGNALAIDIEDAGGNGTTTPPVATTTPALSFIEVEAVPNTGILGVGADLEVYFQATSTATDVTLAGACTVNGVSVAGTFQNLTDGLYKVVYTVGQSDVERTAGQVPVSCSFQNALGATTTVSAFTDSNTVAIDIAEQGGGGNGGNNSGGNGTTTPPTATTTPIAFSSVFANPNAGMRFAGDHIFVHFQSATFDTGLSLGGSCTVNGVAVGPLEHLNNGHYRVDYTVGPGDTERAPGTVPFSCVIKDSAGATTTVSAFTEANTVAIDTDHDGMIDGENVSGGDGSGGNQNSSTTPQLAWASITPGSGTLTLGGVGRVYFQEFHNQTDLAIGGACRINGVDVTSLDNLGAGLYRLNYVVALGHPDRGAGEIPISCVLTNGANQSVSIVALDPNALAIDVNGNGSYTDGQIEGDVEQGALGVSSISQVRSTATAGGGFGQGWEWTFNVTVPSDEQVVRMKFGDWVHTNGVSSVDMEGNMRISSEQASSSVPIVMAAAGVYSDPMAIVSDLDPSAPGLQIQIKVEMKVPSGAQNGSYGTYYGIQSSEE